MIIISVSKNSPLSETKDQIVVDTLESIYQYIAKEEKKKLQSIAEKNGLNPDCVEQDEGSHPPYYTGGRKKLKFTDKIMQSFYDFLHCKLPQRPFFFPEGFLFWANEQTLEIILEMCNYYNLATHIVSFLSLSCRIIFEKQILEVLSTLSSDEKEEIKLFQGVDLMIIELLLLNKYEEIVNLLLYRSLSHPKKDPSYKPGENSKEKVKFSYFKDEKDIQKLLEIENSKILDHDYYIERLKTAILSSKIREEKGRLLKACQSDCRVEFLNLLPFSQGAREVFKKVLKRAEGICFPKLIARGLFPLNFQIPFNIEGHKDNLFGDLNLEGRFITSRADKSLPLFHGVGWLTPKEEEIDSKLQDWLKQHLEIVKLIKTRWGAKNLNFLECNIFNTIIFNIDPIAKRIKETQERDDYTNLTGADEQVTIYNITSANSHFDKETIRLLPFNKFHIMHQATYNDDYLLSRYGLPELTETGTNPDKSDKI